MRKFDLGNVLVQSSKRISIHPDAFDGMDTGETDGGFNVNVSATGAGSVTANSILFTGVVMESDHPKYPDLTLDSLKDVARQMLERDYTK